jgi:lipid A 3-O-deacylase
VRPVKTLLFAALSLLAVASFRPDAQAGEPDFLTMGVGVYDMFDDQTTAEFRVEYVFSEENKLLWFTPFVGLTATAEGGTYGYAGIGIDIFFGKRFVVTPNFAAGVYGNGDGKDLGHAIEFRSGANFAYRFDDYSRLGFAFHHISNAGLDERNPGEETLMLTYSIPLDAIFRD